MYVCVLCVWVGVQCGVFCFVRTPPPPFTGLWTPPVTTTGGGGSTPTEGRTATDFGWVCVVCVINLLTTPQRNYVEIVEPPEEAFMLMVLYLYSNGLEISAVSAGCACHCPCFCFALFSTTDAREH